MRAKQEAQQTVRALRQQGLSYRDILQQVPVAKSSISLWCRSIELDKEKEQALQQRKLDAGKFGLSKIEHLRQTGRLVKRPSVRRRFSSPSSIELQEVQEIKRLYQDERFSFREVALRMGIGPWRVYRLMRQHRIPLRRGSEQNYATYKTKPQFVLKKELTPAEEQLRIAGAMLYWAEGTKGGTTVDLANCDPDLIALFLDFLRTVCGVAEQRLHVHLYAYADQDVESLKLFWSKLTNIPLNQFIRPHVRPLTANVTGRKMRWGLVHVTYSDGRLLELILRWGKEFAMFWAGARVAKWSGL